ncbi:MAG: VanZ family protein [Acidobacteriota bacterium]|nr:VanZ family protein [Acidobacteriota bacterium]MDE3170984.1 VanZ family protein [Acidobacteriota bacterium]
MIKATKPSETRVGWARLWLPVPAWAGVIFYASTSAFSAANTGRLIIPMLHWLFPGAPAAALAEMHFLVRKSGHFTEYFVFGWLLLRALRAGRRDIRLRWALAAIAIGACYATFDEWHQSFVPGRGGLELSDILIDTAACGVAQAVAAMFNRRRLLDAKRDAADTRREAASA